MRITRRYFRHIHDAEDAAQEALLRAWRQRRACRNPHEPGPWIAAIARREALRRISERPELGLEAASETSDVAAHEELERVATRLDVTNALHTLSHEDRRLLGLRYSADLTQGAVAATLGVPEGTVKVRLHRLREQLRDRLG